MANKNTKARNKERHKEMKKRGFPKPVFKARKNPYPRPDWAPELSAMTQRQMLGNH